MAEDPIRLRERRPQRQQLPEEVAAYVRELILSGEVRPGDYLRMEPIAEAVGVSNTPVREGLLVLRSEGFVELVPRRGFVVASFTQQDVRDLFWTQAQLASELAARTAKTASPELIDRLVAIDTEFARAIEEKDDDAVTEFGHQFHREINMAASSNRLTLLLGSVVRQLPNRFYTGIEGHLPTSRSDHAELIEALRKHNTRKARTLTERHILEGAEGVITALRERGMWSAEETA